MHRILEWLSSNIAGNMLIIFSKTLIAILVISSLIGCASGTGSTPQARATATAEVCQPSQIQASETSFPEIQGTMHSDGEVWALLFFDKAHATEEVKIVWRITGQDGSLAVEGRHEDGIVISPVWGPEAHEGSNWERPGAEWGTGFNFPKPGCWTLTATRGKTIGEIRLAVLPQ
jgi:hypothetical protein